jgi:hypothetical protein
MQKQLVEKIKRGEILNAGGIASHPFSNIAAI